eukprot:775940-Rhodomonas_salina.1
MASRGDVGLGIEALLVQQVENHSKTIDEFKNKLQSLREENQVGIIPPSRSVMTGTDRVTLVMPGSPRAAADQGA